MLYETFKIVISYNIRHGKEVLLPSFLMQCCMKTVFSFIFTTLIFNGRRAWGKHPLQKGK